MSSFLQYDKLVKAASADIEELTKIVARNIDEVRKISSENQRFYREFDVNFSYDSNRIEGNSVTLPETYDILQKNVTVNEKPLKDQSEIRGHSKAFNFLIRQATDKHLKISQPFIKTLHKLIFDENELWTGEYRTDFVLVKDTLTGKIEHKSPAAIDVEDLIEGLLEDYYDFQKDENINIFALLAGFHLCYENIHPFSDGNGRTGRLLLNFELMKLGFLPINIKYSNVGAYYATFQNKDNYEPLTLLFLREMLNSIDMYKSLSNAKKAYISAPETVEFEAGGKPEEIAQISVADSSLIENIKSVFGEIMFGIGITDPTIITPKDFIREYKKALGEIPKSIKNSLLKLADKGYPDFQLAELTGINERILYLLKTE